MQETINIEAIILRREAFRERDSRVTVISRTGAILELVARGTISINSKLSGHLEPFTLSDIMRVSGRRYDYAGTARARNSFARIKQDYDKSYWTARALSELAAASCPDQPDPELYSLVRQYLEFSNSSSFEEEFFFCLFLLKAAAILGYKPDCSPGRTDKGGFLHFDYAEGRIRPVSGPNTVPLSEAERQILKNLFDKDFYQIKGLNISQKTQKNLIRLILLFYRYQLTKQ